MFAVDLILSGTSPYLNMCTDRLVTELSRPRKDSIFPLDLSTEPAAVSGNKSRLRSGGPCSVRCRDNLWAEGQTFWSVLRRCSRRRTVPDRISPLVSWPCGYFARRRYYRTSTTGTKSNANGPNPAMPSTYPFAHITTLLVLQGRHAIPPENKERRNGDRYPHVSTSRRLQSQAVGPCNTNAGLTNMGVTSAKALIGQRHEVSPSIHNLSSLPLQTFMYTNQWSD
ncbi:uncharacterized protein EV420DRAFT_255729 [Desarmillaria tabescens]|uniref:Uncharacterized protein n=1 Tax=Armillaria tabescens TaxID=1929756 RepID=A0AA39N7B0_ARMTA|nr:uncharacterized protein EV420DRAFT_255729 [Desarmillaria tabescens]KAK0460218.1 hypothetical protein EV420DRAFT_255729 [Desarmillaria tabescens]